MALKVWLPLNKDTRNVGLFNSNPTPNNVELSTNGVFNNCYKFSNNVNSYINANVKTVDLFEDNASYSVTFWVKLSAYPSKTPGGIFGSNKYKSEQTTGNYKGGGFGVLIYSNYISITHANSTTSQSKRVNNIPLNTWLHIAICYNNNGNIVRCYVNGEKQLETTFTINYSTNGSDFIVGRNSQGGCTNPSEKYINDFRIYDHTLTEEDVLRIYNNRSIFEIPYSQEAEKPEYPLWLKLLHHNAPANNLFTAANCKKNSDNDLYSRCGWLFGNTIFKLDNGKYEMLAKEKTESGSTENIFRWTQTSSPTASTITGFSAITNVSGSHLLGLKHNGSYAAFHNGSTYWCACGSYTKYNGGNPGFKDVIKSGYLDLFVRAEIKHLPSKYEELEYIQSTGTQYIDTGINPKIKPRAVVKMAIINATDCDYWGNNAVNGSCYYADFKSYKLQYYRYGTTTSQNVNFTVGQNEIHVWDVSDKVYVDGSLKFTSTNTYTYNSSQKTIQIFKAARASYYSSYKLYNFKLYDGDELCRNFVPAKRKSDNVIGLYDLVSHKFFTNSGTGSFTGA